LARGGDCRSGPSLRRLDRVQRLRRWQGFDPVRFNEPVSIVPPVLAGPQTRGFFGHFGRLLEAGQGGFRIAPPQACHGRISKKAQAGKTGNAVYPSGSSGRPSKANGLANWARPGRPRSRSDRTGPSAGRGQSMPMAGSSQTRPPSHCGA